MIQYRPAQASDAENVCLLMWEVSFLAQFLYSTSFSADECLRELAESFQSEKGRFSYKNFYLAEDAAGKKAKIVGLVFYYDYKLHAINAEMVQKFNANSVDIVRPVYQSIVAQSLYISALIVDTDYRNAKIGAHLIAHVKAEAQAQHYPYLSLHIWDDNQKGISFYEKNGFVRQEVINLDTNTFLLPASKRIHLLKLAI